MQDHRVPIRVSSNSIMKCSCVRRHKPSRVVKIKAMASILEQYRISDFLEWESEKRLVLNPDFQRGPVWTATARSYLIDTILRQLPMPKVFLRTNVDIRTKRTVREVVDGQQRLKAILDFANDKFILSNRSEQFAGSRYSTLNPDLQEIFLSYAIAVDQLLNATNDDVLEVFARLNSYSVPLNAPEKRHARLQGDFKWAVRNASRKWSILWDKYRIISVRNRVRMMDDSLMAEMFGILIEGVRDGGQPNIDRLYTRYDDNFNTEGPIPQRIDEVLTYFLQNLSNDLEETPILNAPHFLMLFAALAHALYGIPSGDMQEQMPNRIPETLNDLAATQGNLLQLAAVIDADDPVRGFEEFYRASKSSTQRIASRRIRFPVFYRALLPQLF